MSVAQAGKQMKALAGEVLNVVWNSAGEMERRQRWGFFVKNLPMTIPSWNLLMSASTL